MSEVAAKTGLDDYLVAGGTVQELLLMARPFEPVDFARERLKRDERLQAAAALRRQILRGMPLKIDRQNTAAAVMRVLTDEVTQSGELVERGGRSFVRVVMDRRTLAERAAKSKKAVNKAIEYLEGLEGEERILRDNDGRQAHKAGAFLMPVPIAQKGTHNGGGGGGQRRDRKATESFSEYFSPVSNGASYPGGYPSALSSGEGTHHVPPLRYPKVVLYWARRDGRDVVAATHYVRRLGPKRENIVRYVLEAGGEVSEAEVMERFAGARTRPWDFRRRTLGPLLGVLTTRDPEPRKVVQVATGPLILGRFIRGDGVAVLRALPGCLDALERHRESADEIADAERQRERHARQRKKFRENYPRRHEHPAEKEPELMGKEKVRPIVEARRADDERVRIEHQRQKVGITAEVFLSDELEGASGFRWQELRALWTQRGGKGEELRRAVQDAPYRFRREEADGGALYVYPKEAAKHRPERQKPAAVVPMRHEAKPWPAWTLHPISEEHPLDCECHDCTTRAPSYAKIGSTA